MIEFHKVWIEQCEAARDIRGSFGLEKAIGYLVGEKLLNFLEVSDEDPVERANQILLVERMKRLLLA